MTKYIIYNPFKFIPFFRFEKVGTISENDKEIDKIIIDNERNIMILDNKDEVEVIKERVGLRDKLFFCSFELALSAIVFLWGLYLFFSARTDILSLIIYLLGFIVSVIFSLKHKFILANIIIGFTCLATMLSLFIFYQRVEIVFQHIGVLAFSFFFVVSLLYRLIKKRNLITKINFWYRPNDQKGKYFFIIESGDNEIPLSKPHSFQIDKKREQKSNDK